MKNLLLDSHILIWLLEDKKIGSETRKNILTADNVYYSIVSIWELFIKSKLNKITLPENFIEKLDESGLLKLSLDLEELKEYKIREFDSFLKDPFDQILISQAISKDLYLVTFDDLILKSHRKSIDGRG